MSEVVKEMPNGLGLEAQKKLLEKERKANNVWNKLKRNKTAMVGLVIVCFMIFIAVFAPVLAGGTDPNAISPANSYLTFGQKGHLFGTDGFGRDLFTRILYGARVSLFVAAGGTVVGDRKSVV